MFASHLWSRFASSSSSSKAPLLPVSKSPQAHYTDVIPPSDTDASACLLALARQEAYLQSHIQYLLDVQSRRLLEGLGADDDVKFSAGLLHGERARAKRLGLGGARKEIGDTMDELRHLKQDMADTWYTEVHTTEQSLRSIANLQAKKTGLKTQIRSLESSSNSTAISAQERELQRLDCDIREAEDRLYAMRARQRVLREEVQVGRNREEAKEASWKGALELFEEDERQFLRQERPRSLASMPTMNGNDIGDSGRSRERNKRESVWDLPPNRRTLEMAREYYIQEKEELRSKIVDVQTEDKALEEGVKLWDTVIAEVQSVETLLEQEMQKLGSQGFQTPENGHDTVIAPQKGMDKVLQAMDEATKTIGGILVDCETRGWKLLIECVGAEYEALTQAKEMLRRTLEDSRDNEGLVEEGREAGEGGHGTGLEELRELDQDIPSTTSHLRDETDDDEPGPELLISR
ncbi:MAG: hypothetical protein LQ350_003950 [Teloschistes chrysophthalmus]|nr:MAG: hypothetical protein LQ350_003950 [Niorma chrysophthalma]